MALWVNSINSRCQIWRNVKKDRCCRLSNTRGVISMTFQNWKAKREQSCQNLQIKRMRNHWGPRIEKNTIKEENPKIKVWCLRLVINKTSAFSMKRAQFLDQINKTNIILQQRIRLWGKMKKIKPQLFRRRREIQRGSLVRRVRATSVIRLGATKMSWSTYTKAQTSWAIPNPKMAKTKNQAKKTWKIKYWRLKKK